MVEEGRGRGETVQLLMPSMQQTSRGLPRTLLFCSIVVEFALLVFFLHKARRLGREKYDLLISDINPDSDQIAHLMEDQLFLQLAAIISTVVMATLVAFCAGRSNLRWPWKTKVDGRSAFAVAVLSAILFVLVWRLIAPVPVWKFP